ncbi:hypothetical protein AVEN_103277-1 [Araneus ventricosus]|uniref:Uncharacterized protein n=1 Tax=Araneus ventricosus TaxID=182803 RepID=A0A4Y2S214_ARAVE|nr:hypothetical protein AVEN_103277-1 [Araneus ventricosus]
MTGALHKRTAGYQYQLDPLSIMQGLEVDSKNIDDACGRGQPRRDHRNAYVVALCFTARSYRREFDREGGNNKARIFYRNKRNTESRETVV